MTKGWKRESARHALARRGMKTGRKKLLAFAKEERQTAKEYKKLGFAKQGKQEAEHAKFFKKRASELQPFALKHEQSKKKHGSYMGETFQYDVLGQFYPKEEGGEAVGRLYQEKWKGRKAEIVWMSPDEYFKRLSEGIKERFGHERSFSAGIGNLNQKMIDKYARAMKRGDKFAMAWLEYEEDKYSGHEGKHRVAAARQLGIKSIPVVIANTSKKFADEEGWSRGRYNNAKAELKKAG